jgi:hypothetical protein
VKPWERQWIEEPGPADGTFRRLEAPDVFESEPGCWIATVPQDNYPGYRDVPHCSEEHARQMVSEWKQWNRARN